MHRISSRQDAMLEELHEVTTRIEKLSRAEHDLIRDVHPQVSEIKEHVEDVREVVSPEKNQARIDLNLLKRPGGGAIATRLGVTANPPKRLQSACWRTFSHGAELRDKAPFCCCVAYCGLNAACQSKD